MIRVEEKKFGRSGTLRERKIDYIVRGTDSDHSALVALWQELPPTWDGLLLDRIELTSQIGNYEWEASGIYTEPDGGDDPGQPPVGTAKLSFQITGETTRITHVDPANGEHYAAPGQSVVEYEGIGDDGETIEGVEILTPKFGFTYDYTLPGSSVTTAYLQSISGLVGRVNASAWKWFGERSVLLTSINGSVEINAQSTLQFTFAYSPNEADAKVGNVTIPQKGGWDYVDVKSKTTSVGGILKSEVTQATVWKVYKSGDFSLLRIP